jgi:hypothetical protein
MGMTSLDYIRVVIQEIESCLKGTNETDEVKFYSNRTLKQWLSALNAASQTLTNELCVECRNPITPYRDADGNALCISCAEGLSTILNKKECSCVIQDIGIIPAVNQMFGTIRIDKNCLIHGHYYINKSIAQKEKEG